MKWSKFKAKISIIAVAFLMISHTLFANLIGTTGASFLKIGIGARPAAMGNAFFAQSNDLNAFHWNPAGLFTIENRNIEYSHTEWFQGLRYESLRYVQPYTYNINLGASLDFLYSGEINGMAVDQYGIPTNPLNFSASDMLMTLSISYKYGKNMVNGWNLKLFRQNIYKYSGYGAAVDAGWLYKMGKGDWLRNMKLPKWIQWMHLNSLYKIYPETAGFVIKNIGAMSALDKQSFPLPSMLAIGITKEFFKANPMNRLMYDLDFDIPYYKAPNFNLGFEYIYNGRLSIRAGYKSAAALGIMSKFSFGFGIYFKKFNDLRFDYAFSSYGDLGLTHQVSLTMKLNNYTKEFLKNKPKLTSAQKKQQRYDKYLSKAKQYETDNNIKKAIKYYVKAANVRPSKEIYQKIGALYKKSGNEKYYNKYMAKAGIKIVPPAKKIAGGGKAPSKPSSVAAPVTTPSAATVKVKPSREEKYKALYKRAQAAYNAADYQKAISLVNEALKIKDTPELHDLLGNIYIGLGDVDKATTEFNKSTNLKQQLKFKKQNTNNASIIQPKENKIAKRLQVRDLLGKANMAQKSGNYTKAVDLLNKAVKIQNSADIHQLLGNIYIQMGSADKAAKEFAQATAIKKASVGNKASKMVSKQKKAIEGILIQVEGAEKTKDYQTAVSLLKKAISIKATSQLHEKLGNVYLEMGNSDKAALEFEKALK